MLPRLVIFLTTCTLLGVRVDCQCDYWTFYDGQGAATSGSGVSPNIGQRLSDASGQSNGIPPLATVITRVGVDLNTVQQSQLNDLYCLEVLDNLIALSWQEEIAAIPVKDLGNFSTEIPVPDFDSFYSNPEAEWIQKEGMASKKLDQCVRNLVSKVVPRMDQEEVRCLNRLYPSYLRREMNFATKIDAYIVESSMEQLPFKSYFTYFEMTQLLFDNRNIDALDDELRSLHEDMVDFYIKTEEDKEKKIFVIEQECQWVDARALREVENDDARYQKFGELVKKNVNRFLFAEILRSWIPGVIIPEYRYNVWSKARQTMEKEVKDKITEVRSEKRDAQYLCSYAAQMASKFYAQQRAILFEKTTRNPPSMDLKTYEKYAYVEAVHGLTQLPQNDARRPRLSQLVQDYRDGHYCLTNFIRMVENHQRYLIATAFLGEMLPYGNTYCHAKDSSGGLVNPRYCKCQGTFCEVFGMATIRADRYELNFLANSTYKVSTKATYGVDSNDPLVSAANKRIQQEKFNTWWYNRQKKKRT